VGADRPAAACLRIAKRDIEVADERTVDGGNRRRELLDRVESLLGLEDGDGCAVAARGEGRDLGEIVRAAQILDPVEAELEPGETVAAAGLDDADVLLLPGGESRDSEDREAEPGVAERLAPVGARKVQRPPPALRKRCAQEFHAVRE